MNQVKIKLINSFWLISHVHYFIYSNANFIQSWWSFLFQWLKNKETYAAKIKILKKKKKFEQI